jgi:hypothetical protein
VGPERTRISYIAVPHKATYAAFRKESSMKFANATKLDRKSGVAQGRDLQFHSDRTQMPTSDHLPNPIFFEINPVPYHQRWPRTGTMETSSK